MKFKILTIIVVVVLSYSLSFGTTYYISKTGADNNAGTFSQPWQTIAKANSTLGPGDIVYIRAGNYNQTIRPSRSGTEGNYITYANYNNEKVTITNVGTGVNLDNREYIKIDGITIDGVNIGDNANVGTWISINKGNYNIIQNCDLKRCRGWDGISISIGHHNKILNNTMQYCGSYARDNGDMIALCGNGSQVPEYNLLEGNDLSYAGHNLLSLRGRFNVVRNNYFHNPWERDLELQYLPYHNLGGPTDHNLFEGNRVVFASPATDNPNPPGMKIWAPDNIIRRNLFYNNVSYAIQSSANPNAAPYVDHNKIYHNVFYNNGKQAWAMWDYSSPNTSTDFNIFKNNIVYGNQPTDQIWFNLNTGGLNNNKFSNNNIIKSSPGQNVIRVNGIGTYSLNWYQQNYPNYFAGNVEVDPLFVDETNYDFQLQSNSPMMDAGTFLTSITSPSGSGSQFSLQDAGYFTDGFDIVEGDLIQLEGQTQTARITKVDYNNNIITIDKSLTWTSGQGISLSYSGTAPDIGAFEYGGASPLHANANASPTSGQVPLTVNFTGNATGGAPPYSYSWDFGDNVSSTQQNPTHTYSTAQSYTATLIVTDNDGNQDTDSITINTFADTAPPTGTIVINNGATTTYSTSVVLTLSATDDQSGMGPGAEMKFSNDNVTWTDPEPYTTTKDWTLSSGDGIKTVYVNFKDAAGNWMANPVNDDIILDTSTPAYLIHNTFEQQEEGWGGAVGNTGYARDNSSAYQGSYSMHVYTTGTGSKLSIGVNPVGWNIDGYPFLTVAYKIPANVPVGIFFDTNVGWICLGGSRNYDAGGYPVNNIYTLIDDDSWHLITINVRDKIREVYPSANNVLEFEWYTQNNGQQGDEFWFDEVMILTYNNAPPTASISLSDPSPTKAGTVDVTLTTSKNVVNVPTPLIFIESDNSTTTIDLQGAVPGTIFSGKFNVDDTVAEGIGFFSLATDALVDEDGNTGNEIISGTYVRIDRTPPASPQNLTVGNGNP